MIHLNKTIDGLISNGTVEHIAVRVGKRDDVICDVFRGDDCETTLFDMASVTKIMVTTSLALIALDKGLLQLNDTVDKFYTTDKSLSVKNLLWMMWLMYWKPHTPSVTNVHKRMPRFGSIP